MNSPDRSACILLVDDKEENLTLLSAYLQRHGYRTVSAQNGQQTLKTLERLTPDLILLDIMMPGTDGFEVCKQLKANPETQDIPIVFLTAKNNPDDLIHGFELGAVDYIAKPFSMAELLVRVHTHLDLQYHREELKKRVAEIERMKREHEALWRHELGNALMPVIVRAELFLEGGIDNLTEDQREKLQGIFDGSQRVVNLLEGFKNIQALENGTIKLSHTPFTLDDFVAQIAEDLEAGLEKNDIVHIDNQLSDTTIEGDKELLMGALTNLIKNAIEHVADLPDDSEQDVRIALEEETGQVILKIQNGGPPIPPENLARFFDKFNTDREKKKNGTGLGTTYAYWAIKAHRGDISVSSEERTGTIVTVYLPKSSETLNQPIDH